MKKYRSLFLTMLKIGLFTFGGGYAMIALLQDELVDKKRWIDKEEFLDVVAIAESTPGPIAINAATYIGYKGFGIWGACLATLAVCIPSFCIIFALSYLLDLFLSVPLIAYAFAGIRVGVIYLILSVGLRMWKQMKKTVFNLTVCTSVLLASLLCTVFAVRFSTVFFILICGFIGILFCFLRTHSEKEENK